MTYFKKGPTLVVRVASFTLGLVLPTFAFSEGMASVNLQTAGNFTIL
ncbi:MAG: hypothetical protein Q7R93_01240 [bacterium]|nr:hypothetical protein [bacterium]